MKVFALGTLDKPMTDEQRAQVMAREVPATLKLYLEAGIEQFWFRSDKPGVVFLMEAASIDAARATIGTLPLVRGGFISYEFIPVGPLAPLGLLLQGTPAAN